MVTLLMKDQIWGEDALDVIKIFGALVEPTDLAVLRGAIMSNKIRSSTGKLVSYAWTAATSPIKYNYGVCALSDTKGAFSPNLRLPAIRPVLSPVETAQICPTKTTPLKEGIKICDFGEYPQTIADGQLALELERSFAHKTLRTTGKHYTFDSSDVLGYFAGIQEERCVEYEHKGRKYIRVLAQPADDDSRLSNGQPVQDNEPYWVRVAHIEWLVDPTGFWVARKCLLAGIQFDANERYEGDFSQTFMKKDLNTYFIKEIQPSILKQSKSKGSIWTFLKQRKGPRR